MKENGLEWSGEKTCLILFNNGETPKRLPQLELDGQIVKYKQNTKFLGVCLTPKVTGGYILKIQSQKPEKD